MSATTADCTPRTCGCKARTSTDALAGALFATGRTPKLRLELAVHSYRHTPDPAHLEVLHAEGLDGIARALEQEATALPGIGRDDATARVEGWLRDAGSEGTTGRGDGFGLGGKSTTR